MKSKVLPLFVVSLFVLCSCAAQMSGLQRQALETEYIEGDYDTIFRAIRTVFQNEGYAVEQSDFESGFIQFTKDIREKNAGTAFALGCLPGGGSFYTRSYGMGVFDLLFWPLSILWDPATAASRARQMYKTIKVSTTLTDLEEQTEVRTGFIGVEEAPGEYGIMLKRMYAEVRRQALVRKGRSQTPSER